MTEDQPTTNHDSNSLYNHSQPIMTDGGTVNDNTSDDKDPETDDPSDHIDVSGDGGSPNSSVSFESEGSSEGSLDAACSERTPEADEDDSNTLPSLTPSVRRFVLEDRNNECELCGADGSDDDVDLEIHHRLPKADGGTDHPHNLVVLCQGCHRKHHGNEKIRKIVTTRNKTDQTLEERLSVGTGHDTEEGADESSREITSDQDGSTEGTHPEPLPPHSEPNEADRKILSVIEENGPVSTGELAAATDYSKQYIRRQCWKLGGEQLIVAQTDDTWELTERASDEKTRIGLPDNPEAAKRAGRDEMIRRMSAYGMAHTKIADITGYSYTTVDFAVNRARALRIDDPDEAEVDLATIATRLSALLDLIDQAQTQSVSDSQADNCVSGAD